MDKILNCKQMNKKTLSKEQINSLFFMTIKLHENEWFGERKNPRDRNQVQAWVAKWLAETLEIYTVPSGCSWGTPVDKKTYEKHYKEFWKERDENNN